MRDRVLEDIYDIHLAIRLIEGDQTKNCVVAVDEVNRVAEPDWTSTGVKAEDGSRKAIGYLLAGLGQAMLVDQSQLVGLIAGTLISTFTEAALRSRIHIYIHGLDVLCYSQQCIILVNFPALDSWRRSKAAKDLLLTLGGVLRLGEWFINVVSSILAKGWDQVDWESIRIEQARQVRYKWASPSIKLARCLVGVIILRLVLTDLSLQVFPGSDEEDTYGSLQQYGQILLTEQGGEHYVTMPLMTFRGLVDVANGEDNKTPEVFT